MKERAIQPASARMRPPAVPAEYDRPPAELPNGPAGQKDVWLAQIVSGLNVGKSYQYAVDGGCLKGFYLDEINPQTFESFYPSRTRNAANEYIEAVGWNLNALSLSPCGYDQWPIDIGSKLNFVWVFKSTGPPGGIPQYKFSSPYTLFLIKVTSVTAKGWPNTGKWNYTELTEVYGINRPGNVSSVHGYYAYPPAVVDDLIVVGIGASIFFESGRLLIDLTPRIPIKYSDTKPGSSSSFVKVDSADPSLWTIDNDT